jgi:hypothetical protein
MALVRLCNSYIGSAALLPQKRCDNPLLATLRAVTACTATTSAAIYWLCKPTETSYHKPLASDCQQHPSTQPAQHSHKPSCTRSTAKLLLKPSWPRSTITAHAAPCQALGDLFSDCTAAIPAAVLWLATTTAALRKAKVKPVFDAPLSSTLSSC